MSELVYRQPCKHGRTDKGQCRTLGRWMVPGCPGGVERVLGPDKMLIAHPENFDELTVADVLEVLDREGQM